MRLEYFLLYAQGLRSKYRFFPLLSPAREKKGKLTALPSQHYDRHLIGALITTKSSDSNFSVH